MSGPPPSSITIPAGRRLLLAGGRIGHSSSWRCFTHRRKYAWAGRAGEGTPTGTHCAKRSQFPAGGHQRVTAGKVSQAAVAGPRRTKQNQSRQSGTKCKYLVEKELWRIGLAKRVEKTKPIPARIAIAQGRQDWQCRWWDPLRQTKPIDSAPTGNGAGWQDRKRLSGRGQARQTKPISGVRPAR